MSGRETRGAHSLLKREWSGVAFGEVARGVRGLAVLTIVGLGLGAAAFAVVAIVGAIHTVGRMLGTLGLANSALRHFATGPWTRRDDAHLVRLMAATLMSALAYVAVIAIALPLFLANWFEFVPWTVWLWALALFPLTAVDHVVPYALRARRQSNLFAGFFVAELVVGVVAAAYGGLYRGTLEDYYIALFVGKALMLAAMGVNWSHASKQRPSIGAVPRASMTTMLRFGISTMVVPFGVMLVTVGDRAVLGTFASPATLGAYAAAAGFAVGLWSLPQLVYFGLYSQVVHAAARGDRQALQNVIRQALRAAVPLLVAGAFVLGLVTLPSLQLVFGHDTRLPVSVVWLLAVAAIVGRLAAPFQYTLEAHDRGWVVQSVWIGAGVTNIALNILVVPEWGAAGAAAVSSLVFLGLLAALGAAASRHLDIRALFEPSSVAWLAGFAAACTIVLAGGPAGLSAVVLLASTVAVFVVTAWAAFLLGPPPWRSPAPMVQDTHKPL